MQFFPDSEGLREFNKCHDPKDGKFCSGDGGDLPPEPGTTPIPPGMVRGYHYTDRLDSVLAHGLSTQHAKGSTYGEPNVIWMSTEKPKDFKEYVEVFVTPEEIGLNGPGYRGRAVPQAEIDAYNARGHDFYLTLSHVPPSRFVTHSRPWMHHARHMLKEYPASNPAAAANALDLLSYFLDDPGAEAAGFTNEVRAARYYKQQVERARHRR